MKNTNNASADATLIYFNEYTTHYYSQSSNPWEAAHINCFQTNNNIDSRQAGVIIFSYPNNTTPPGQENTLPGFFPTFVPITQINHLEKREEQDFFVLYYELNRFDDVINLLRNAVAGNQSMLISADAVNHVWALCNNLRVKII